MNNKANRQCADVDIREFATGAPFLFFNTANVVGLDISAGETYAKAKGRNRIGFTDPMDNSFKIEAQILPFEAYALIADGTIKTDAYIAKKETIKAAEAGKINIPVEDGDVEVGSVFVYAFGNYGGTAIQGTYADKVFSGETIEKDVEYEVAYIEKKTSGVKRVALRNDTSTKAYSCTMLTNDKDEENNVTVKQIKVYKAKPKREISLEFKSEGDPASITINFSVLDDKDGNNIDIVEIDE